MQENNYIIEVNSVSKFFGDKTALDNVTLNVKKGEFVTILSCYPKFRITDIIQTKILSQLDFLLY